MKEAKKACQWFLCLTDLGLDFLEWITYIPTIVLKQYFPDLSNLVARVRECSKDSEEAGALIGSYLSKHKTIMSKFGEATMKKGYGKGYVDAKLLQ